LESGFVDFSDCSKKHLKTVRAFKKKNIICAIYQKKEKSDFFYRKDRFLANNMLLYYILIRGSSFKIINSETSQLDYTKNEICRKADLL